MPWTEDGYVPDECNVWIPGVDFDPYDQDEMEILTQVVWPKERMDAQARLERENEHLRRVIADLQGTEY